MMKLTMTVFDEEADPQNVADTVMVDLADGWADDVIERFPNAAVSIKTEIEDGSGV